MGRIWDESGTKREIRGTTGTNDVISLRQANKDLNGILEKGLIKKQGKGRAILYILK
ncbi:hypothetical protein KJ898_02670 [bacterium]|nr:hypothetical protein [bacterium]MBU1427256.1 hypothetical protein [bacterium]